MKNNQDNLKYQVMGGMFWKLSERILAQGVSFLVSVVLARMLTPDEYGIVAIVLVLISLANVFVTSGFSVALVQNKNSKDIDFSTNFWCSIAVSVCIYFLLFIIAPLIELFYDIKGLTSVIRVFGLIIPLSAFSAIQHAYVERNMLFKKYFFSTLFGTVVSGIIGIVMAMYGMGVWALVFQYFTNTAVDIIVLLFTVNWRPKFEFSILSAKHMMSYGWKILVADFFGTFFEQLRSLIVGKVYSSSDLAFYNKGNQLPTLITTNVSSSIMTVLFPAIANISDNYERVHQITRRAVQVVAYIMFPLLFGLAAVSDNLVLILFTEKWLPASIFVKILSIGYAISMIGSVSIQSLKAVGRSDVVLRLEFIKKPIYVLLLILGVNINVTAVAVTMAIYNLYGALVNSNQLRKVIGYKFKEQIQDLFPMLLLSTVIFVVVNMLSNIVENHLFTMIIQIAIGTGLYITMSVLFKIEVFGYLKEMIVLRFKSK